MLDVNHKPVAATLEEFGAWMDANNKQLARDEIDGVLISTVFLGVDTGRRAFSEPADDPLVFETMVFCAGRALAPKFDRVCVRYCHYDSALEGHRAVVDLVKAALNKEAE